jgi:hypothetical protein
VSVNEASNAVTRRNGQTDQGMWPSLVNHFGGFGWCCESNQQASVLGASSKKDKQKKEGPSHVVCGLNKQHELWQRVLRN